jgi:hypothetical protein
MFFFYFTTLDSNATERKRTTSRIHKKKWNTLSTSLRKEPRDIDIQGKPSKLVAYLILVLLIACFINVYENACLYIAITSL